MDKLKSSLTAKIIAGAWMIISLIVMIASFSGMLAMDAIGGYQTRKEDMLKKGYEEVCRRYSVAAMAAYKDGDDAEELSQTDYRYGIVKAEDIASVDFQDPKSYAAGNFEEIPDTDALYLEEYDIGEDTEFSVGDGNIFLDSYYIMQNADFEEVEYDIAGWFYDKETKSFYVRSQDQLFPVQDGMLRAAGDVEVPLNAAEEYVSELEEENRTVYQWENCTVACFYETILVDMNDILIVDADQLAAYGEVSKETPAYFEGDTFFIYRERETEHFIVASYVNQPLAGEQSFESGDMFAQIKLLVDFAYRMRYPGIALFAVSLIMLLASFSFLMAAAGHRKGQEGISIRFLVHLQLDLYFGAVMLTEGIILWIVVISIETAAGWTRSDFSGLVSIAVITVCAGILAVLIGIAYCMSFAVHVKVGKWWRYTLAYIICRKCMRLMLGGIRLCVYVITNLLRSITLLWKAWLVLAFLAFAEFAVLESSYVDSVCMTLWMLEKMILYPMIIIQLLQMNKLQKGAQQIANGSLDYQIDTRYMFWEIRKHGEYLNDIGHGINCAVNERMKSEHFKTELITNVSHDIKTPLTSIINYVDLLQKEEINNPTVQEYLEVLHRQSARLKKLIEDLMEASKASTGSLSVEMERCDAGVMLVQTIGEFEEKLMAEQIELQIKKPETDIFIEADHRHLWRVFDNLMNNICKYAQPSTRAYINLEQHSQRAVITFRNISKYQLNISSEELMERFVRGDSSRNTEGSGLGISIAKSLTELMNGTFELIIDGDLFKVVLTFPLYGTMQNRKGQSTKSPDFRTDDFEKKNASMFGSLANGIQNAGAQAAGFGHGMADKTGRMFRRAGRFVSHVKQAAEQAKAEEAEEAEQNAQIADNENEDGH